MIQAENAALNNARQIVTPHPEIAALFRNKSVKLDWFIEETVTASNGTKILFPASTLGRKGAYEMKQLVRELGIPLIVYGQAFESAGFWEDLSVSHKGRLDDAALIVYPAYVENQPRLLLKAIAKGIPIVTTTAAGLSAGELVKVVPFGDYNALKTAVKDSLQLIRESTTATIAAIDQ